MQAISVPFNQTVPRVNPAAVSNLRQPGADVMIVLGELGPLRKPQFSAAALPFDRLAAG